MHDIEITTAISFGYGFGPRRTVEEQVRAVLDKQVEAWNKGDTEGFSTVIRSTPSSSARK